ncbi:MAG: hypothetical protein M3506_03625 [Chloroflexota bacterium]|nr:hypothetical protein [Chloroflexota bacterium]
MREGKRCNVAILALVCLAPLLTAGICRSAADEARSREQVRILWSEPILAPPPGSTQLLRSEVPQRGISRARVAVVYASPRPLAEAYDWYLATYQAQYRNLPNGLPERDRATLAGSRVDGFATVMVALSSEQPPGHSTRGCRSPSSSGQYPQARGPISRTRRLQSDARTTGEETC